MNLKKIRALSKLISFMYTANIPEATKGTLKIGTNDLQVDINGTFRRLSIFFNGSIYIHNNLPDGYGIRMKDNTISITNFLLKNLKNNKVLLNYNGNLEVLKAHIITVGGKKINLKIDDLNVRESVNNSKTNFEDSSLLFLEEYEQVDSTPIRIGIDDDSIKGLFAHKPLPDGYTGNYNYHPKEKIYMTGKTLTSQSQPVGKLASSFKLGKTKVNLENVYKKNLTLSLQTQQQRTKTQTEMQKQVRKEKASVKEPKRRTKKTGGSY